MKPHSDPGGEILDAPIGSTEWAKRWRIEFQRIWHYTPDEPQQLADFYFVGTKHRVWTLLNKSDGSTFKTFAEFCLAKEPWGLSSSPDEVNRWLAVVKGKKATDLETVAEPIVQAGPGRGHKLAKAKEKKTNGHDVHSFSEPRLNTRLRATNRAPEPVRRLYEQDKLSQHWAVKLGPKNPSPDEAALIAAIVLELKGTPDRRTADGIVKRMLGTRQPSIVDKAFALVKKMSKPERKELFARTRKLSRVKARVA